MARNFNFKAMGHHELKLVTLFLSLSLLSVLSAEAAIHYHNWEVKYEYKSPDCYQKLAITINGQTPGPTIKAEQGDTIVVKLKNSLVTENVAIHWHGIPQVKLIREFNFEYMLESSNIDFPS